LYLHANHELSFSPPTVQGTAAADAYLSDPANPVPYRARPIIPSLGGAGSTWSRWLVDDQRFLKDRADVVSWQTAPLTDDVVIAGDVTAHLFASTTGSDADWVVKLIDVYPEDAEPKLAGYQLMVSNDVLRGRFRKGFVTPLPITPNKTEEFAVDMHTQNYKFSRDIASWCRCRARGSRSSTEIRKRSCRTFSRRTTPTSKRKTHRIFRSKTAPSYVQVSVVGACAK
jgi:predicted acyl esterase